jgi:hypothetical protein
MHPYKSSPRSTSVTSGLNYPVATFNKASVGQLENQSIVQQLTSEGNFKSLVLKTSPNGDIAITQWIFAFTLSKY